MRTILILITIYYVFKLIARYVLPFFLKRFIHKMQDKAQQQQYKNQQQETNVNVGETSIDKKPNQQHQGNKSVGEYVDYEEID
ncbi:MAG: DUF4834 family protein [Polaribacter sp.]|nr:DUF4834 family protein [Polaribacter sp.]